jgi:uroporphyrinogen III methyltransferase / synthase
MENSQMTRARKAQGRIAFVGSGPGDTGLLTVRANELLTRAELVVTDPDVPSSVLALVGADVELRPAVGDPADVAKDLVTEAKAGR